MYNVYQNALHFEKMQFALQTAANLKSGLYFREGSG
jgi:hypothetical protein